MITRAFQALVLVGLALGVVACGPEYDRTTFSGTVADDLTAAGTGASVNRLSVHEGMILKSHIVAWNDENVQMKLSVRALDPSVLDVAAVISPHDFAFVGKKVGKTRVEFVADDTLVLVVNADVLPQPELPPP